MDDPQVLEQHVDDDADSFLNGDGQPLLVPGQLFVDSNYALRVSAWASVAGVTLGIRSRHLRSVDGQLVNSADQLVVTSNRVVTTTDLRLPAGWPLSINVQPLAGTPMIGQCYVMIQLIAGNGPAATVLQTIAGAYIQANIPMAWPGAPLRSSLEGPGAILDINTAAPGAGLNFTETMPAGTRRRLQATACQLVTSAAVANRLLGFVIDDGANFLVNAGGNVTQAASGTNRYTSAAGQGYPGQAQATNNINFSWPTPFYLLAGWRVKSQVAAIDAADVISLIQHTFEEWLTCD